MENKTVYSFILNEDDLTHCVFYLREGIRNQKKLFSEQELSLGNIGARNNQSLEQDDVELMRAIQNLEKNHPGLKQYRKQKDHIFKRKFNFGVEFLNFFFNLIIFGIMIVQLYNYLDSSHANFRQAWVENDVDLIDPTRNTAKGYFLRNLKNANTSSN